MNKRCYEIYKKAEANPKGLRFQEMVSLCKCIGMRLDTTQGSHWIYILDHPFALLSIQKMKDGKAKPYQVRELLNIIEENGLDHLE